MSTATVRQLTLEDQPALLALDAATNSHPWHPTQWTDSLKRHYCLGLELDQQIIGSAVVMLTLDEAELLQIAIAPEQQNRGLGQQLLAGLIQFLQDNAAERLFLEVRASNAHAKRFYIAAGFTHMGRRKGYYPTATGREDALLYQLDLLGVPV